MQQSTIINKKYQKLFMSIPPGRARSDDLFATSRGTIKACAWNNVDPRIMNILQ